jgi:hypothetical protein
MKKNENYLGGKALNRHLSWRENKTKNSLRKIPDTANIRTWNLPSTIQKRYHLNNQLGILTLIKAAHFIFWFYFIFVKVPSYLTIRLEFSTLKITGALLQMLQFVG